MLQLVLLFEITIKFRSIAHPNILTTTIPQAEALSLRAGLMAGLIHGWHKYWGRLKNSRWCYQWKMPILIENQDSAEGYPKSSCTIWESISFHDIWGVANFTADTLAHIGHQVEVESWKSNFPSTVMKAISFYLSGRLY